MEIRKAARTRRFLRVAVSGPTGSGKSFSAMRIGLSLLPEGKRLGIIDSEDESANDYANAENPDGGKIDFDSIDLSREGGRYSPENYIRALRMFEQAGYPVVIIDSLSHAWAGEGGVLRIVDRAAEKNNNTYAGWRKGTPEQDRLIDAVLKYPGHVIVTMRSKMEYVLEPDKNGKNVPRRVGMSPVQRDGVEYEFTVGVEIDMDHNLTVNKTRIKDIDGLRFPFAGANFGKILLNWISGAEVGDREVIAESEDEEPESVDRESMKRAFYKMWGGIFSVPTQKEGLTKEQVDNIKAEQEHFKALCLKKWFGVSRLRDVPARKVEKFEKTLRLDGQDMWKERVDKVIAENSGENE